MTTRRALLITFGLGLIAAPLACLAQQQRPKPARVGLLMAGPASTFAVMREALVTRLRDLGYVEGKNILFEYRGADGKYERLAAFAAELVQMKVDVIVAGSSPAISAAQKATTTIPIVMAGAGDPIGTAFVASLARPGRNVTGMSNIHVDVISKYLELIRAAIPKLSRVAVLANLGNPAHANYLKRIEATAKTNSVTVLPTRASTASEIEEAFVATKRERADALLVLPDAFFSAEAHRIADLATQHRLPSMFSSRGHVEAGGLMSYGANRAEQYRRVADYVDKILKGAKPGDLPVEQPTNFELVINLKTAKAIGLTIPKDLLFRADKVIE